jgi:hypothetical protein
MKTELVSPWDSEQKITKGTKELVNVRPVSPADDIMVGTVRCAVRAATAAFERTADDRRQSRDVPTYICW